MAPIARDDKNNGRVYSAPLPREATEDSLHPGSNNWVVSGAHTASGKPLLSNDMHLDLHIPNVWYEAHLTAGDFDVAGVTLPGVPFVISGHNRYIAWGFTNLGPNVEDLYIEKFNDKGEYLTPQGWLQPERRKEIIRVKGRPEVNVDVEVTRHGPIISDIIPGEKRKLALKWIIYDPQAWRAPFFAVDSAKNWQEFRAAFSQFGSPGQNVVYADVDGHIGYQATGMIPIRAAGDGSVPVPGDDNSHEWIGYVPYDKLPSVYDPASGIIATANGRVTPDGYPYTLSIEWASPYRTERIYKLLNANKKLTPPDMLAIQTDIVSAFDRFCAERFVYAVDHTSNSVSARQDGRRPDAELGRHHEPRLAGADRSVLLPQEAGRVATQAKTGCRLEAVQVVHESGVAGEHPVASAGTLAAGRLCQLRRATDGRRRRRRKRRRSSDCAHYVEVGTGSSRGRQASVLEQLSHPEAWRRSRSATAIRGRPNGEASKYSLRAVRASHR